MLSFHIFYLCTPLRGQIKVLGYEYIMVGVFHLQVIPWVIVVSCKVLKQTSQVF